MVYLTISTSPFQSQVSDLLPCNNNAKSSLSFALLNAYGLLKYFDEVITLPSSSINDLTQFHSKDYLRLVLDPELVKDNADNESDPGWQSLASAARDWGELHDKTQQPPWFENKKLLYGFYAHTLGLDQHSEGGSCARCMELKSSSADSPRVEPHSEYKSEVSEIDLNSSVLEKYGLSHDCYLFPYLPLYCEVIAGATLSLVRAACLRQERTISINWDGGRHHASRSRASGFCYINDIVLLVQKLRRRGIRRISYVDFDLHHCDGVERAFQYSQSVQTISVHLHEPGFFPGTGSLKEAAAGKNVVDIPVQHGMDDAFLNQLVHRVIMPCLRRHNPEVIVIQCGGDGLMGDKYKEWQLTIKGLADSILNILRGLSDANVVLLGGGGYNERLMSRFYTYLTWKVVEFSRDECLADPFDGEEDVLPDHEFIGNYKDEFYKFWAYNIDGGKGKLLKNDNHYDHIARLASIYNV
ncbi:LAQU0S04e06744g1_1 [Lachancea quebecensis]|uniref:histone deacetylase n=1 Tax=Lachancea quebecensis TaxID=1654605 RepID=A0A0P1KQ75_9SACH|nr:LAQU0S04e06744g1_1 [Lachancea quebecensis]